VANSLSKLKKVGTDTGVNALVNAALMESVDRTMSYWKPAEGYTVKSIDVSSDSTTVNLWAEAPTDPEAAGPTDAKNYLHYVFTQNDDNQWELRSANSATDIEAPLGADELLAAESLAKRDLNMDGGVGLRVSGDDAAPTGLTRARINEKTYLFVGTVTSGSASKPLDLESAKLLSNSANDGAWEPAEGSTVSDWTVLSTLPSDDDIVTNKATGAKFALKVTDDQAAETWVYFDAAYTDLDGNYTVPT
jgi:hypothetical protein